MIYSSGFQSLVCVRTMGRPVKTDCWAPYPVFLSQQVWGGPRRVCYSTKFYSILRSVLRSELGPFQVLVWKPGPPV